MATYLNYCTDAEAEAHVQAAEWLQKVLRQSKGEEAVEAFVAKFKQAHEVVTTSENITPIFELFVEYSETLFALAKADGAKGDERLKEIESYFALVFSLLLLLEDEEELDAATSRLCTLISKGTDVAELRLRLLMMLYNTYYPTFSFRYRVFRSILDYAAKANLFDLVLPYLEYLDAWLEDWALHITADDRRSLFRDLAGYLRALGKRTDAFLYLKRFHELHKGSPAKDLDSANVQASTLLLLKDAIQLPNVIQFDDLLAYDTVKAFAKSKHAAKDLVALCTVFYSGEVNDLKAFQAKNAKLLSEHEIDQEDALLKIRLLTLATMVHGRSEITLEEIAKKLEETEANVERVVVKALSEKVIDGRIDQLNHKVLVKSAFQRKFEKEEWDFLGGRLDTWIGNLESVIRFMDQQKQKAAAAI
jgi:translation initiation factor 3 subunit M